MQETSTYIKDEMLRCVNLRPVLKRQAFSEFLHRDGTARGFMLSMSVSMGLHYVLSAITYSFYFFNQVENTSKLGKKLGAEKSVLYCHSN